jgi:hypothetical protein
MHIQTYTLPHEVRQDERRGGTRGTRQERHSKARTLYRSPSKASGEGQNCASPHEMKQNCTRE